MATPPTSAEAGSSPYYLAAAFWEERRAGRAYNQAQNLIFTAEDCELSVYRFYVDTGTSPSLVKRPRPPWSNSFAWC